MAVLSQPSSSMYSDQVRRRRRRRILLTLFLAPKLVMVTLVISQMATFWWHHRRDDPSRASNRTSSSNPFMEEFHPLLLLKQEFQVRWNHLSGDNRQEISNSSQKMKRNETSSQSTSTKLQPPSPNLRDFKSLETPTRYVNGLNATETVTITNNTST